MIETKIEIVTIQFDNLDSARTLARTQSAEDFDYNCSCFILNMDEIKAVYERNREKMCEILYKEYGREIGYYSSNAIRSIIREAAIQICLDTLTDLQNEKEAQEYREFDERIKNYKYWLNYK